MFGGKIWLAKWLKRNIPLKQAGICGKEDNDVPKNNCKKATQEGERVKLMLLEMKSAQLLPLNPPLHALHISCSQNVASGNLHFNNM